MKWTPMIAALVLTIPACGGGDEAEPAGDPAATPAVQDTAAAEPAAAEPLRQEPVSSRPAPVRSTPLVDEPWTPTDTGTVSPGMSRDDVAAVWGEPVSERQIGAWTYLYYRNGCEVTCGTFDVVFLQNGQVVDAIVRGAGHTYAGVSSSPPGREAVATPPGSTSS